MTLSVWTNNCSLSAFQCLFLPHLLCSLCGFWQRSWCFRFRTFPLAPFGEALSSSRHSPCDLTTAGLLTCRRDNVKADDANRQHWEEVLTSATTPSVCSLSNNCLLHCLEVFVYVCWHLAQCWHLICVNDIYHSSMRHSPMWDVMLDTVVLAQKY